MKNLILTILASSFILSCSTDSSTDNSSNPTNTGGLLVKTITYTYGTSSEFDVYFYDGNKVNRILSSDGSYSTFTYNQDYIVKLEISRTPKKEEGIINWMDTGNYSYSNGSLISSNEDWSGSILKDYFISTLNSSFSYNSDGTIIENQTITSAGGNVNNLMIKKYFSQGNVIKKEEYNTDNSPMTLNSSTTYSFDNKNIPYQNIIGIHQLRNISLKNNEISAVTKNASGVITSTVQTTYQYNSQNYPISSNETSTDYYINPQTGVSTPRTPTVSSSTITYY